jgi:hypothetical protein
MKSFIPYSLLAAAAACGLALGQTAYTTPVGYETVSLKAGTNYAGIRLHEPVVVAGVIDTLTSTELTDASVNFEDALTGGASTFYVLEITNDNGVIQEVTGASANGSSLELVDDITLLAQAGDSYKIRKASTLASVFGASNSAGLAPGFFGPGGADIVAVPDGAGGADQYYYDEDQESWAIVTETGGDPVDSAAIPLIYTDAMIVVMNSDLDLVVTGEVKTEAVSHAIAAGTNYLGTVFPAGATLESAFGSAETLATLDPGFFGPGGADIIQIPDGAGGADQYYYDEDQESWAIVTESGGDPVDASTIDLPSGILFSNEGAPFDLLNSPPSFYSSF